MSREEKIRSRAKQRMREAELASRQSFNRTSTSHYTPRPYKGEHLRIPTEESSTHYPLNLLKNQGIKARLRGKVQINGPSLNRSLIEAGVATDNSRLFEGEFQNSLDQFERINRQRRGYNKRIPLLFMRPYSKFNDRTRTLEDVKSQLYSSVRRGELRINKRMLIEYYTQYGEADRRVNPLTPGASASNGPLVDMIEKKKYIRPSACNIIRQKALKKNYQKSLTDSRAHSANVARHCYVNTFLTLC